MPETAPSTTMQPTFREIDILSLSAEELEKLSNDMKLSLSREDMLAVKEIFTEMGRNPSDVEMETIAQTWSEHCKHRIFGAKIRHVVDGEEEIVDGLFKTYIKGITDKIRERKPGFVLAAFDDNAGFVELDENLAACLKVETHNHPSAIEPYAGANTGIGGVIRDILGAGKGAKPIANLDVFCFGPPDTAPEDIKAEDVIHPLGIMRGVVRGVRDYGNRMGIPTTSGAIQFDDAYIYNPLVFAGTLGVIPRGDIDKEVKAGHFVVAVGGRTGRDGLKGATFSSAALDGDSHEEDQQAVQIGNPIEEKKVADFVLEARKRGLIEFVTDCGAGGFSSAAGEMLSECGGELHLEQAPLKEPGLISWEVFLSESQERMVLAVEESSLDELQWLADTYETEMAVLGKADGSGILKVSHHGCRVVELDCAKLHEAPRRNLDAVFNTLDPKPVQYSESDLTEDLKKVLGDFAIVSRAPVIREYDHEVQGNTVLKPLAGAGGDAPQDAAVLAVDGSDKLVAMSLSLLPEWGKTDPYAMGLACVDETIRQLVLAGAHPDKLAILDNFCVGNPEDPGELGTLVETVKGMAQAALDFGAPFISGKDSFYNYFETDEGPVSIPVTLLVSGLGVVDALQHVTGSSIRKPGSKLCIMGTTADEIGGSVYARQKGIKDAAVPKTDVARALADYRKFHELLSSGKVLSAHDISEGGLAVAAAEMGFSLKAGVRLDLDALPCTGDVANAAKLFSESTGRILFEVAPEDAGYFPVVGETEEGGKLVVESGGQPVVDVYLEELKAIWKEGLKPYY